MNVFRTPPIGEDDDARPSTSEVNLSNTGTADGIVSARNDTLPNTGTTDGAVSARDDAPANTMADDAGSSHPSDSVGPKAATTLCPTHEESRDSVTRREPREAVVDSSTIGPSRGAPVASAGNALAMVDDTTPGSRKVSTPLPTPFSFKLPATPTVSSKSIGHIPSAPTNNAPATSTSVYHTSSNDDVTHVTASGTDSSEPTLRSISDSGSDAHDSMLPDNVPKENPFYEYKCCQPDDVIKRARYVMARDGIPNEVVSQESGLSENYIQTIREGMLFECLVL